MKRTLVLVNPKGMHARASHRLVETVCQFDVSCRVTYLDRVADGRQIMSVMLLAAPVGSELEFDIQGEQADECMEQVADLIADGLGELSE